MSAGNANITADRVMEVLNLRKEELGFDPSSLTFGSGVPFSQALVDVFDDITGGDSLHSAEIARGFEGALGFLASQGVMPANFSEEVQHG